MLLGELQSGIGFGLLLEQAEERLVAERAVLQGDTAGPVHALLAMFASEADQTLQQAIGAYLALGDGGLRPGGGLAADVFDPTALAILTSPGGSPQSDQADGASLRATSDKALYGT